MFDQSYQPTLSQLRSFVSVATYRHFGDAAAHLNVSQPTLSQGLVSLETGLGVKLIERSTRRVMVTQAGERLLPRALTILEAVDGFVAAAAGVSETLTGPLRLGVIPTVAPYYLPELLRAVQKSLPAVHLHVVEEQTERLLDGLRHGALDVAILAIPIFEPSLVEIPLYQEDFVMVLDSKNIDAGRDDLTAKDLAHHPLLLLAEGHCLRDQTMDLCRSANINPTAAITRAASLNTVIRCVEGGLGVTLVPDSAVEIETASGQLATARFKAPVPGRTIGLAFRASSGRHDEFQTLATILRNSIPPATRAIDADSSPT